MQHFQGGENDVFTEDYLEASDLRARARALLCACAIFCHRNVWKNADNAGLWCAFGFSCLVGSLKGFGFSMIFVDSNACGNVLIERVIRALQGITHATSGCACSTACCKVDKGHSRANWTTNMRIG